MYRQNYLCGTKEAAQPCGFFYARALIFAGRDMTDVWVLDYMGGTLQQTIHQTFDQDDFGTPTLELTITANTSTGTNTSNGGIE